MLFSPSTARTPDHDLLLRTHRGDDRAARGLWARFGPRLTAYAAALLKDSGGRAAADDAVQTVFCRILETPRADLRAVRDVPAWLTTLTRHTALNLRRSEHRERDRRAATCTSAGSSSSPAHDPTRQQGDTSAADIDLQTRLDALDEDLREIVLLKHAAGLTFDQIAATLNQNRSTINSRYRRALVLLRAPLAQPPPDSPASSLPPEPSSLHAGAA